MTPATSLTAFAVLADLMPDGVLILGADGRIRASNDQLVQLLGCARDDIVGSPIERFVPTQHRSDHVGHRERFFETEATRPMGVGLDLWAVRADGTEFPVDVSLRRVDLDGETVVVAAVRDLSEQREAERTRATLEIVRGASRSAVVVVEPSGVIAAVNSATTRLLGVDAEQLVGRPLDDTLLGDTAEIRTLFGQCAGGDHVEERRVEMATAWGEAIPVSVTARPVVGGRGDIAAVSMVLFDRSEEEASQLALRELQGRLEVTERLGGLGSWEFNGRTGEVQMSPGLHALLDVPPMAASGTVDDLVRPMDADGDEAFRAALSRCVETGDAISMEMRIRVGGGTRWIAVQGRLDRASSPTDTVRVAGIIQDLTERHRAMESLLEADRMKDEFLSTVSHELRTPLTVIVGFADHLRSVADDAHRVYLDAMHRNASEMDMMVDQLLDMSRVQSGRVQIRPRVHALRELVADVLAYASHALRDHEVVDQTTGVEVVADDMAFRRVLTNLLSNAAKFSPGGSTIVVSDDVDEESGHVIVTVSDNGIGIAPSEVETIFEMFVQAREGRPTDVAGTGVGLTIVRRYVEMQGGEVWVESEPGRGARFRFTIPLHEGSPHEDGPR